jgi:hypothetical protein
MSQRRHDGRICAKPNAGRPRKGTRRDRFRRDARALRPAAGADLSRRQFARPASRGRRGRDGPRPDRGMGRDGHRRLEPGRLDGPARCARRQDRAADRRAAGARHGRRHALDPAFPGAGRRGGDDRPQGHPDRQRQFPLRPLHGAGVPEAFRRWTRPEDRGPRGGRDGADRRGRRPDADPGRLSHRSAARHGRPDRAGPCSGHRHDLGPRPFRRRLRGRP